MSKPTPLVQPAWLWDNGHSLPGRLELTADRLLFHSNQFHNSHLHLEIPLKEIVLIDTFLVFDLARSGLRVKTRDNKVDFFVLEQVELLKTALEKALKLLE